MYLFGLLHGSIYLSWLIGDTAWPDAAFFAMMTLPLWLMCMVIRTIVGQYVEVRA
jgi:hypothetical protein